MLFTNYVYLHNKPFPVSNVKLQVKFSFSIFIIRAIQKRMTRQFSDEYTESEVAKFCRWEPQSVLCRCNSIIDCWWCMNWEWEYFYNVPAIKFNILVKLNIHSYSKTKRVLIELNCMITQGHRGKWSLKINCLGDLRSNAVLDVYLVCVLKFYCGSGSNYTEAESK